MIFTVSSPVGLVVCVLDLQAQAGTAYWVDRIQFMAGEIRNIQCGLRRQFSEQIPNYSSMLHACTTFQSQRSPRL